MASVSLEFQGVQDASLPLTLVGVIGLLLIAWGVVQLVRRRTRYGLVCMAAAFGPAAFVPAMVADAALRYARGLRREGGASLLAAIAAAAGAAVGGLLILNQARAVWMVALALQIAIAVGVFYSTAYAYLGCGRILTLMALRVAGILALMLVLFKPALSVSPESVGDRPYLPILVDRSASMATADETNLPDRYHQAVEGLRMQQARLEKHFRPLWHHFAMAVRKAESPDQLAEMNAAGEGTDGTNLAAAIRAAAEDRPRADLAGIVLLTDGIHNGAEAVSDAAVEAGVPVYLVGVGSADEKVSARRNVQIVSVDAPMEAVVNNVTAITVRSKLAGFATAPMELQLLEEGGEGKPADTQRLWTDQNVATLTAQLKWTPRELISGAATQSTQKAIDAVRRLKVHIPRNPAETIAEDNDFELHVLLTQPHIRVLYVEGTIRPEYKFLSRLLKSDPNIRFVALVRMEGNRFWSQGDIGGKKLDKLPETEAEFALFDVIILGDLDRTFLSKEQMALLRKFVNGGGGLLMLGGHSSFGPGGYGATDVESVLPVNCGTRNQPQERTPFVPQLTAIGEMHPIFEGLKGYFYGPAGRKPDEGLQKLPSLTGCVTVAGLKSGAQNLAMHPTRPEAVTLAVQNVGAGRSAAFTADTTWSWYLSLHGMGADSPYERFWGQMVRWLANVTTKARESKPSVVLRLDRTYVRVGDDAVKVLCRVQDEKGRPADNAQVSVEIAPAGGGPKGDAMPLSPRMGDRLFEGEHRPSKEGTYRVTATAKDAAGAVLGSDELMLTVTAYSKETDRLARNDALMQLVADRSGGRAVDLAALPDLIDQIVKRQKSRADAPGGREGKIVTLYDFTLLFMAFVMLLTAEWLLRRQWHLR